MIDRKELISSKEYWLERSQVRLFAMLEEYMSMNKLTRSQLAEQLGVSKGYISQILNGSFDHRLSKLIELSLAVGNVPVIQFIPLDQIELENRLDGSFENDRTPKTPSFETEIQD
jgi:transcriptional regulator with XRE-family HTH domain